MCLLPGVIAANMHWNNMNAVAGIVWSGNCGALPTPLNKKWPMNYVNFISSVSLYVYLLESPIKNDPVSEKVRE